MKIVALKAELRSLPPETPSKQRLAMQNKLVKLQVALHWMKEVCNLRSYVSVLLCFSNGLA